MTMSLLLLGLGFALLGDDARAEKSPAAAKMNVLFIAVDDLRPTLGCYGDTKVKSPNIDRLAASGATFLRAYCQQAVCSPSRTSLLLGLRPDTTRVYDLNRHFRDNLPDVVTLPQMFAESGYSTCGIGKIYHGGLDDPKSWNYAPHKVDRPKPSRQNRKTSGSTHKRTVEKGGPSGLSIISKKDTGKRGPPWQQLEGDDSATGDGYSADVAIATMQDMKNDGKPFFLAVGFLKPHLPFNAPKRYFDLYSPSDFELPANYAPPKNAPDVALHTFGELRSYAGVPEKGPVTDQEARELIHAYHAATSFVDAQIGRVLDELDRLGLAENTVVVLWGDHGWHLGDQGIWCKHSNFEAATHSPLLVRAPGTTKPGEKINALVEFVDIYPTLGQLCGLKTPASLEGSSLAPLLKDPQAPWKQAAFSQYPRGKMMGYSIRTDRYRYTEWMPKKGSKSTAPVERELYDQQNDPLETENIADRPDMADTVKTLHEQLEKGWKGALPPQTASISQ